MKAWYFANESRTLGYGDGRPIVLGETHAVDCVPKCCAVGLHGSRRVLDALRYAFSPIVYRVELSGVLDVQDSQISATHRTYLAGGIDMSDLLHDFARRCALDVVHLWDAPDVVVRWLKTGDESIRAASITASRAASRDASRAAWDASFADWDAAWVDIFCRHGSASRAARDAAFAAGAASRASEAASRDAGDASRAAGDASFAASAAGDASRAAARDARTAAGSKQNRRLTAMVCARIERVQANELLQ